MALHAALGSMDSGIAPLSTPAVGQPTPRASSFDTRPHVPKALRSSDAATPAVAVVAPTDVPPPSPASSLRDAHAREVSGPASKGGPQGQPQRAPLDADPPTREVQATPDAPPAPMMTPLTFSVPLTQATATLEPSLPGLPQALAPHAVDLAADDSAHLALSPAGGSVSLDVGDTGHLSVQLKVTDGVTDVRASGSAAPMLEHRQNELRFELAQAGLTLGRFDLAQHERRDQREEADPPPWSGQPKRPSVTRVEATVADAGVHVKA